MLTAAAIVVLLVLAAAAISFATSRAGQPGAAPMAAGPAARPAAPMAAPDVYRVEQRASPTARHLRDSNAAEATHTLTHENGLPGLEGKSAFAELGTSVDDRMARVHGEHQRRHARTLSRPRTAQAIDMMRPWLEPRMAAGQSRDWWGAEDANAP